LEGGVCGRAAPTDALVVCDEQAAPANVVELSDYAPSPQGADASGALGADRVALPVDACVHISGKLVWGMQCACLNK